MTHPLEIDDRPVALIFRSPLFNASEGFVQAQTAGLTRYQPVIVGLEDKGNAIDPIRRRLIVANGRAERWRIALGDVSPLLPRVTPLRARLVHAHFGPDGLRALPLARRLGIPLITTFRGYDMQCSDRALLLSGRFSWMQFALGMRRLAQGGARFLTVSDALRDRAIARGFPSDQTQTHYNGVDITRFRPDPRPGRERLVLHVGRLVEKKGTRFLLRAFARVAAAFPDARLVIAGDGPLRSTLERQARVLGIGERVQFLGHTPANGVAQLMREAWLLAAPSLTARTGDAEGLPNVVVEAAASGLPVVASKHAGIPEAVLNGVTGFLVPEAEHEPLGNAMLRLLASADLQADFGQAARHLAEQRFDARRQAERLEAIYDEVSSG